MTAIAARHIAGLSLMARQQERQFINWAHADDHVSHRHMHPTQEGSTRLSTERLNALATASDSEKDLLANFLLWKRTVERALTTSTLKGHLALDESPFSIKAEYAPTGTFNPFSRPMEHLSKFFETHAHQLLQIMEGDSWLFHLPCPASELIDDLKPEYAERLVAGEVPYALMVEAGDRIADALLDGEAAA